LLQGIAAPLLFEAERRLSPASFEKYIVNIVKVTHLEGKVLGTIFRLANPPQVIITQLKQIGQAKPMSVEVLSTLMKAARRAIDLGVVTLADLIENAIVHARDFTFAFQFFYDISADEFEQVSHDELLRFFSAFARNDSPNGYRFVVEAAKKSDFFWAPSVAFMTERENTVRLSEWCTAAHSLTAVLDGEALRRLYDFIHELTIEELRFGHITSGPGLKLIQTRPAKRRPLAKFYSTQVLPSVGRLLADESLANCPENDTHHVLPVRGWREIALLLRLAPPTAVTLELLNMALELHERPFAQAFSDVLRRFGSLSVVVEWLETLFNGRQSRKILGLDILCLLVRGCQSLFQYLAEVLRRFSDETKPDDVLPAKVRGIYQEVLALQLPPDVIALFEQPDARTIRFAPFREGRRRSVSGSASLPPQMSDSKLPMLCSFPSLPAGLTDAKPLLIHVSGPQRRKRFSLIA
jgi:hypothetical protein